MGKVTVLTGAERRRRWSLTEKQRIVEESLAPGQIVAEVARRHDVHPNLLYYWRKHVVVGAPDAGREPMRFAPVSIASAPPEAETAPAARRGSPPTQTIEVVLRNGRVLRCAESADPERLGAFARALEEGAA